MKPHVFEQIRAKFSGVIEPTSLRIALHDASRGILSQIKEQHGKEKKARISGVWPRPDSNELLALPETNGHGMQPVLNALNEQRGRKKHRSIHGRARARVERAACCIVGTSIQEGQALAFRSPGPPQEPQKQDEEMQQDLEPLAHACSEGPLWERRLAQLGRNNGASLDGIDLHGGGPELVSVARCACGLKLADNSANPLAPCQAGACGIGVDGVASKLSTRQLVSHVEYTRTRSILSGPPSPRNFAIHVSRLRSASGRWHGCGEGKEKESRTLRGVAIQGRKTVFGSQRWDAACANASHVRIAGNGVEDLFGGVMSKPERQFGGIMNKVPASLLNCVKPVHNR
ncbi:hypothetical protein DFH06DRAFT_1136900 [Mycena polygramma]|nr:hypothetical protein DFH06DRAFT_1136900 [Mycena polygramma]